MLGCVSSPSASLNLALVVERKTEHHEFRTPPSPVRQSEGRNRKKQFVGRPARRARIIIRLWITISWYGRIFDELSGNGDSRVSIINSRSYEVFYLILYHSALSLKWSKIHEFVFLQMSTECISYLHTYLTRDMNISPCLFERVDGEPSRRLRDVQPERMIIKS